MKSRKQENYHQLFVILNDRFNLRFGRSMYIKNFVLDFEIAPKNVVENLFSSNVTQCYYHLVESYKRKLREETKFTPFTNSEVNDFFLTFKGISFLDPSYLPVFISSIKNHVKTYSPKLRPGLNRFIKYFESNYLKKAGFDGWNYFAKLSSGEYHFTNNASETINGKLKALYNCGRNNIAKTAANIFNFKYSNSLSIENDDFSFRKKELIDKYERIQEINKFVEESPKKFVENNIILIAKQLGDPMQTVVFPPILPVL